MSDWKKYQRADVTLDAVGAVTAATRDEDGRLVPANARITVTGAQGAREVRVDNPPAELAGWVGRRVVLYDLSVGHHAAFARSIRLANLDADATLRAAGQGNLIDTLAAQVPAGTPSALGAAAPGVPASAEPYTLRSIMEQAEIAIAAGRRLEGDVPPPAGTAAIVVAVLAGAWRVPLTRYGLAAPEAAPARKEREP